MNKADVMARGALANAAGREADTVGTQPFHRFRQVVNPQTHVVQRRCMNRGLLVRIERLHQIDLDLEGAFSHHADVFIDVLALAHEVAGEVEAQLVDPKCA
jgi:hypothetical protein